MLESCTRCALVVTGRIFSREVREKSRCHYLKQGYGRIVSRDNSAPCYDILFETRCGISNAIPLDTIKPPHKPASYIAGDVVAVLHRARDITESAPQDVANMGLSNARLKCENVRLTQGSESRLLGSCNLVAALRSTHSFLFPNQPTSS